MRETPRAGSKPCPIKIGREAGRERGEISGGAGSFKKKKKKTTDYDVYALDGLHDCGYYTVKYCVTIYVLARTPGNNVYIGFMVCSNFTATECRGLSSLNGSHDGG